MDIIAHLSALSVLDFTALFLLTTAWFGMGWWIEHPGMKHPSVTILMAERNRAWMQQFVTRQPRIFDSQIVGNLRQGTSFFASTNIFAIGGVLALMGNVAPLQGLAAEVTTMQTPAVIIQLKLALVALFLSNAFLKFVWAHRVFGYCSVLMAAVPNDPDDPAAYPRAAQAAELNIRAAVNFNRGLRSMYFALGAVLWLAGPMALLAGCAIVVWVVWSREFASLPRRILLNYKI